MGGKGSGGGRGRKPDPASRRARLERMLVGDTLWVEPADPSNRTAVTLSHTLQTLMLRTPALAERTFATETFVAVSRSDGRAVWVIKVERTA